MARMSGAHQTADADKIESADGGIGVSIARILKLLARPELAKWRLVMVLAILLTLGAAVLEIVAPILVGVAINQLVALGYIERPSEDQEKAVAQTVRDPGEVNEEIRFLLSAIEK